MVDPKPLREGESAAGRDLEQVRRSYDWPLDRRVASYWALRGKLAPARRRAPRLALAFAGCAAAAAAAWLFAFGGGSPLPKRPGEVVARSLPAPEPARFPAEQVWTALVAADLGTVEASPSASLELHELAGERQLRMQSGVLRAQISPQFPGRPVVVVTAHLRVVVVGTRFNVLADEQRTGVDLFEGHVRVESEFGAVLLGPGESITSDDPRLSAPPAPVPVDLAPGASEVRPRAAAASPASRDTLETCELRSTSDERERCFRRLSQGGNLAAQNALYTLGMIARRQPGRAEQALKVFREYGVRFPRGALAAEAVLRELELLRELGRPSEAAAVARRFEERFPADPRAPEVALVRATLLCGIAGRGGDALSLLERLADRPEPPIRQAAAALRHQCSSSQGTNPPDGGRPGLVPTQLPSPGN